MCLAGIEAEMKALIARKQAAEVITVTPKTASAQPELQKRPKRQAAADRTIPTLRRQPAAT